MNNEKPGICPECGSDHFEADAPTFTSDYQCEQSMHCLDCDCYWYEKYQCVTFSTHKENVA